MHLNVEQENEPCAISQRQTSAIQEERSPEQCQAEDSSETLLESFYASQPAYWLSRPAPTLTIASGPWTCLLGDTPLSRRPRPGAPTWSCRLCPALPPPESPLFTTRSKLSSILNICAAAKPA